MEETSQIEVPIPDQTTTDTVTLGRWLGRHEAFGLIAGRCSAAEAESLRHIRDSKLYRLVAPNWDEFCSVHVGASRRNVERSIHYLDEFGPVFFEVMQIAHIGPEEYRAIAGHVYAEGIQLDDSMVPLSPENSLEVAAAVAELLRRAQSEPASPEPPAFVEVLKRCGTAARMLDASPAELNPLDKMELAEVLCSMLSSAFARGLDFSDWLRNVSERIGVLGDD
jgi:hypothetical protein